MNIGRVHHLGMIVPDLDRAIGGFRDVLGLELDHIEPYGDELEIAFLPCGETLVELIRPLTEEGFSADWLASAGPGVQHCSSGRSFGASRLISSISLPPSVTILPPARTMASRPSFSQISSRPAKV